MGQTVKPQVWRWGHPIREKGTYSRAVVAGMGLRFIEKNAKTYGEYLAAVQLLLLAGQEIAPDLLNHSAANFKDRIDARRKTAVAVRIHAARRIYRTANRSRIKGK